MFVLLFIFPIFLYFLFKILLKRWSVLDFYVLPWMFVFLSVSLINDKVIIQNDLALSVIFLITLAVAMVSFLVSQIPIAKHWSATQYGLNVRGQNYLYIFAIIICVFLIIVPIDAILYSRGIGAYVLEARYALMNGTDRPGILGNALYYRVFKNLIIFGHLLSTLLIITKIKKIGLLTAFVTIFAILITGERWGAIYILIGVFTAIFFSSQNKKKIIFWFGGVFVFIFSIGSLLRGRSEINLILQDVFVYFSGGLYAFMHLESGNCRFCYTPQTSRYITSLLGLTDTTSNVAGSPVIFTDNGLWTNTFSVWGSTYYYGGWFFAFFSIILLLMVSIFLTKKAKSRGIIAKWYLLLIIPALPLTIFTETFYQLAPMLLRSVIFIPFILGLNTRVRYNNTCL